MNTIDINKLQATLLSYEQINGAKRLKIFDIFDVKATPSDFAILLGAYIMDNYRTYDNYRLEHRFGYYWTKTSDEYDNAIIVRPDGSSIGEDLDWRDFGTRPVLSYSLIANESKIIKNLEDKVLEIEYGEYPKKAATLEVQTILNSLYNSGRLLKTGRYYTTDSRKYNKYNDDFQAIKHIEYEYNNKKYIRVKANSCFDGYKFTLSNEQKYCDGDYVWVEVMPIRWLVDKENNIAVSKNLLFSGIQFDNKKRYKGNFEDTIMYMFLNRYFIKEIMQCYNIKDENREQVEELFSQKIYSRVKKP